jgi:uncharacterized phage protein gp47/JayE
MSYGITDAGFILKRLIDIKEDMDAAYQSALGAGINIDPQSPLGQIIGISSDLLSVLWELAEAIYDSASPNKAEGSSLDDVASITNLTRLAATKSTVTGRISGTNGTIIPVGFVASVTGNPLSRFATIESGTIAGGYVDLAFEAEETGPTQAPAASLAVIETPVSGADSVTNALDADVGRDTETDSEFRIRRLTRLQKSGTAAIEGIRNALRDLDGVIQAAVYENVTMSTDIYGRPAKSIECIVSGGDDAEIAQAIFDSKAAGIQAYGEETEVVTDSQGVSHSIGFTRPEEKDIYMIINITPNTDPEEGDVYPVDGDDLVKAAVILYADQFLMGQDVVTNRFWTPINTVPGVIGIEVLVGLTNPPTSPNNISMAANELAVIDTSRITVNS